MSEEAHSYVRKMSLPSLIGIFSIAVLAAAIAATVSSTPNPTPWCRTIPGDASWPNATDWNSLNKTVSGRLIHTVPVAASCHDTLFGKPNPTFDPAKCDALRNVWFFPATHLSSSSSPMAYPFGNDSCNPFSNPDTPCDIGNHNIYAVKAMTPFDIQTTIRFAKKHNIRLVIRNTGHDYLGKSIGAHSLAIWTHYMKDISLTSNYRSKAYTGPAITMGAGVEVQEAYSFANSHKLMVVGGNCPTVGMVGGYIQGGGHGPLASKLGLAADQVLEWQVVTADGRLVTASPSKNSDLFWALRGGGGSTFGVVVSATVKAFPDTLVSMAGFQLPNTGTNADEIYKVLRTFLTTLPSIVDSGVMVSWVAGPFGLILMSAFAPGMGKNDLDTLFGPTLSKMKELDQQYQYASTEHPTFFSAHSARADAWNVSDFNLGGRLIPRSIVEQDVDSVVEVLRFISEKTLLSGVGFNIKSGVSNSDEVATNPYMRESLFNLAVGTQVDYTDWKANKVAQDQITNELLPRAAAVTPNGGAYLNEADFQDPDWKALFFGSHYTRLEHIKFKYDPNDVFYARTAVGSDRWEEKSDGRLCKTHNRV